MAHALCLAKCVHNPLTRSQARRTQLASANDRVGALGVLTPVVNAVLRRRRLGEAMRVRVVAHPDDSDAARNLAGVLEGSVWRALSCATTIARV